MYKRQAGADGIKVVLFNHEQVFFRLLKANSISRDGVGFVDVYKRQTMQTSFRISSNVNSTMPVT